ncbi:MAG: glycosyl hydrolase family 32 [Actinomycetales bacterium]|nr:glycosyl hydrolase family 32 [Actinomycetales bacterium]
MLHLPDAWVWDSWYFDDGERFHAFYLKASRALHDPDARHHRAAIGHAVSTDLRAWQELPDALVHSDGPAFDDLATWTGSTIVGPDGRFHLFYTGVDRAHSDRVQRIGHAVSADLLSWNRVPAPPIEADPRYYEALGSGSRYSPWRDPWVFRDEGAGTWRMLVTASLAEPIRGARGCIGTAVSDDMVTWRVEPPLSEPAGFSMLEVPQTLAVDGSFVLVWCMRDIDHGDQAVPPADGGPPITGTWSAPADSPAGPFHLDRAEPIRLPGLYAGRVMRDRAGGLQFIAFVDREPDGRFGGYLTDPVPLVVTERGTLQPAPHS